LDAVKKGISSVQSGLAIIHVEACEAVWTLSYHINVIWVDAGRLGLRAAVQAAKRSHANTFSAQKAACGESKMVVCNARNL
jgi:hypothetical protein